MTSPSFVRLFGAALLVAAGCGGSSNAGPSGTGGSSGGTKTSGTAGSQASGVGGTTGSGGSTGSGVAGTTGTAGSSGGSTASGAGGTGVGGGGTTGTGGTGGKISFGSTQCSDGIDNDGDGLIDYADPECIGPLDNDESSFATGIPGDNIDPCKQDCFFDGNSGMGDDGCLWQLQCDPQSVEPKCPYSAQFAQQHPMDCSLTASQSQTCINKCQKLVPNGCDCFGCCVVPGVSTPIRLAATCTAADFGDPTKCPPCTQVTQCANPCGHCEICIGKPTLPPDCSEGGGGDGGVDGSTDGPATPNCGTDYIPCGPGTPTDPSMCPQGTGCVTGCCIPLTP